MISTHGKIRIEPNLAIQLSLFLLQDTLEQHVHYKGC